MPRKKLTSDNPLRAKPLQKIVLDWKAYFIEFCRVHGEPVEHEGRLLFRDGWTYSATDYSGPEKGPPSKPEELDLLTMHYWVKRKEGIKRELLKLTHALEVYAKQQSDHSLPLQQMTSVREGEKVLKGYTAVDLAPMKQRVKWMRTDIEECDQRLREIEEYYKQQQRKGEAV